MDIEQFSKLPLMGILRGVTIDQIAPLVDTCIQCGLQTIEITMNTPDAPVLIREMQRVADGRLTVGAGTVLTMQELHDARAAGASFIVSPVLVEEVVAYCVARHIPVFPGALTPQEIYTAWKMGATMVKVFPAHLWGPEYFQEVRGPFHDIKLLACGKIVHDNVSAYFACGASAVAFGSTVFNRDWLNKGEYHTIAQSLTALLKASSRCSLNNAG